MSAANTSPERTALAAEALSMSGRLRLRVRGESMLPALWPGEEVEIEACALNDLRAGHIALARRDGRFFLHRFIKRCPDGTFLLRGDSVPKPDLPFVPSELLGRMVRSSGRANAVMCRCLGLVLCSFGPVRRIALRWRQYQVSRELQSLKSF